MELNNLLQKQEYNECKNKCLELFARKEKNENENEIYYYLGMSLRGLCKYKEAEQAFIKANSSQGFYNLGRMHGEAMSYHRREDLNKMLIGKSQIEKPKGILFTCFDEQNIINGILEKIKVKKICVDIGAGDGITFSNSYNLYKNGWKGLSIECNNEMFFELSNHYIKFKDNVSYLKNFITPDNINSILKSNNIPKDFGFLSLDIDSYDYYVLEKLLSEFEPGFMCIEINEKIPPPFKFALKYNTEIDLSNFIQGQSISMLYSLLQRFDYSMVHLEYNNVFAIKNSLMNEKIKSKSDVELYNEFKNKKDWFLKMPWNKDILEYIWNNESNVFDILKIKDSKYYYFELN